jgi:hypothetical protein
MINRMPQPPLVPTKLRISSTLAARPGRGRSVRERGGASNVGLACRRVTAFFYYGDDGRGTEPQHAGGFADPAAVERPTPQQRPCVAAGWFLPELSHGSGCSSRFCVSGLNPAIPLFHCIRRHPQQRQASGETSRFFHRLTHRLHKARFIENEMVGRKHCHRREGRALGDKQLGKSNAVF